MNPGSKNSGLMRSFVPLVVLLLLLGCRPERGGVPRPEGLMRIDRCDTLYRRVLLRCPFTVDIPSQAVVEQDATSPQWVNIAYPGYGATLWCSYIALTPQNRAVRYAESRELVYVHAAKSPSIEVQRYADEDRRVYALLYHLSGEAATPLQFEVTDSTRYLFRGALYFDAPVRGDSVAPVVGYIADDVARMIETLQYTADHADK